MGDELKVGGDCDGWCTKCRMDLAHTIVAMVDGLPVKAKCNTCGGLHKYHVPKEGPPPVAFARKQAATARISRSKPAKAPEPAKPSRLQLEQRWGDLVAAGDAAAARGYDVRDSYAQGELLRHSKFGLGVVSEQVAPGRVKVLFRDAERVLVTDYRR